MANTDTRGLRFYGIVHAENASADVLSEQKVDVVTYRELAAIVARVAYVRESPGDEELADYVRVVDALGAIGPVIPAPPATVFRDERVLARWLDVHYGKLHEALDDVERRNLPGAPYDYIRMELGG